MADAPQDFPGFGELIRAIASYGDMLKTQGEVWNDAWNKMRSGDFDFKSWTSTVAKSWDANARFWLARCQHPDSPSSDPAWKRIPWPLDDPPPKIEVCLQEELLSTVECTTPFSFVGYASPAQTAVALDDAPGLEVKILNASIGQLELTVLAPSGAKSPLKPNSYYIAFVFETGKIEPPLLIVILHVMPPSKASGPVATTAAKR